jgi:hypothetical protein
VQPLEGLAGQIFFQFPTGNAAKAVMSWAASCSIASTLGNWRAEHASDDAELLADLRRAADWAKMVRMVAATISAEPLGT